MIATTPKPHYYAVIFTSRRTAADRAPDHLTVEDERTSGSRNHCCARSRRIEPRRQDAVVAENLRPGRVALEVLDQASALAALSCASDRS